MNEAEQTAALINDVVDGIAGWWTSNPVCERDGHDDTHIPPDFIGLCLRCHRTVPGPT